MKRDNPNTLAQTSPAVNKSALLEAIWQAGVRYLPLLLLSVLVLLPYYQTIRFDFVNFDDHTYILENRAVQNGLRWQTFLWAFSTNRFSNWHPLTWLSYVTIYQNAGADPAHFHLCNAIIHLMNTVLLYFIFRRSTHSTQKSFLVAALFAIHPMHVQSVAWISELKDVLSVLGGLLSLYCYQRWALEYDHAFYRRSLIFFALSLLAKQTLVTLPIVLLLFDYWPLKRMRPRRISDLLKEKIPYLILAIVASALAYWAQSTGGAVGTFQSYPLDVRLANAASAYCDYIVKLFLPFGLSAYYPYAETMSWLKTVSSTAFLILISALSIRLRNRAPYLFFGWFFYLVTLLPVIGIIQIGSQAMADRYTYIPYIGLFVVLSVSILDIADRSRALKITTFLLMTGIVCFLTMRTYKEVGHWQNSITLFERSLAVTKNNFLAHVNLGRAYLDKKDLTKAEEHLQASIRIKPDIWNTHSNLGLIATERKKYPEAIRHFEQAGSLKPNEATIPFNLGVTYQAMKEFAKAEAAYREAIRLRPSFSEAFYQLGELRWAECRIPEALEFFRKALQLSPENEKAKAQLEFLAPMENKSPEEQKGFCHNVELLKTVNDLRQVNQSLSQISKLNETLRSLPKRYT